jgi:hypothetical protein
MQISMEARAVQRKKFIYILNGEEFVSLKAVLWPAMRESIDKRGLPIIERLNRATGERTFMTVGLVYKTGKEESAGAAPAAPASEAPPPVVPDQSDDEPTTEELVAEERREYDGPEDEDGDIEEGTGDEEDLEEEEDGDIEEGTGDEDPGMMEA